MIVSVYVSCDPPEEDFCNGLNIEMTRYSGDEHIQINIQDDGEKSIIAIFNIEYQELKKAILKLEDKNET